MTAPSVATASPCRNSSPSPGAIEPPVPNAVLRWSGMQGIFPQPYRGWGIAGYTAGEGLRDVRDGRVGVRHRPRLVPNRRPDPRRRVARRGPHRAVLCVHPGRRTRRRHDRGAGGDRPLGRPASRPVQRRHDREHLPAGRRQRRFLGRRGSAVGRWALGTDAARHQRTGPHPQLRYRPARRLGGPVAELRPDRLRGPQRRRLPRRHLHRERDLHRPGRLVPRLAVGEPRLGDQPGPDDLGERRVVRRHGRHPARTPRAPRTRWPATRPARASRPAIPARRSRSASPAAAATRGPAPTRPAGRATRPTRPTATRSTA